MEWPFVAQAFGQGVSGEWLAVSAQAVLRGAGG